MIKRTSRFAAVAALLVLGLVGGTVVTPGVLASHSTNRGVIGGFGIDGDFVAPSNPVLANETRDWASVSSPIADPDPANNAGDDIFGGGSKESEPDGWTYTTGKPPGKDDLIRVYYASDTSGTNAYLWLGFERLAISGQGDAHANFELNRKTTTIVNSKGTSIPERSDGDLLVIYDYAGGSGPVQLGVRRWDGAPNVAATPQNEEALFGTWVEATNIPATAAFADINGTSVPRPAGAPFNGGNVAAKRFGEVGLDLTAIYGQNFLTCPGFSQLTAKTRSSGESFNSALKDRNGPFRVDFSRCGTKNWEFSFDPQPIAGATVSAVYTVANGDLRTLALTDPDGDGTFRATDSSVPPGTLTYHFEVENADGELIWRSDHEAAEGDQNGTETMVLGQDLTNTGSLRYQVVMPGDAENFAGVDHLFTARVSEVGTNKPLTNVDVNFATVNGTPPNCGSVSPDSDDTDSNGEASTTLSSATACTTSVRAFVNGTTTGSTGTYDSGEADDSATKEFVVYDLTVTPDVAVNEAGDAHEFTVTLTKDSGAGPLAVSGATVHLVLNAGSTGAHFTEINGEPAEGTEADCTTDADGQCLVTIVGDTAGETTLTATYEATDDDSDPREISSSGIKRYVDASITILDASAVNEVGAPHTFDITVTAAPDGTGTPTFGAITPTVTPAPDTQSNTCATPTIDGNTATCSIAISHPTAGVFEVHATASVTMGGVTVTRSTNGESGPAGNDGAVKRFVDAAISIDPLAATNEVGDPHTFNITVTADPSGAGTPSYVIEPTVNPTPSSQETTCGDPDISADGNTATCTVTINSTTVTTYTVNATATVTMGGVTVVRSTSDGTSGPGGSGPATKSYVMITLEKTACPTTAPRGAPVLYNIAFSVVGASLTDATLVDTLPSGVNYFSASSINGVNPAHNAANRTVTWSFPSLAPGSYTGTIQAAVASNAPLGGTQVNSLTFDSAETAAKTVTQSLTVDTAVPTASGRAFGLSLNLLSNGLLLGDPEIAPTPDTNVQNPDELLSLPDPFGSTTPLVSLLQVSEKDDSVAGRADHSAIATAAAVRLDGLGVQVSADSVVARSNSYATGTTAGSSSDGSVVQNLVVEGVPYGNISEPTTITVRNPLTNAPIADVHVLETVTTGAAAGDVTDPFRSGLEVNGIHVEVFDLSATPLLNEASDLIVSHAETSAEHPSILSCGAPGSPTVSGVGYAVGVANVTPDVGEVRVAEVVLPVYGGSEKATLDDVVLPAGLGSSSTAATSTTGEVTDGDDADTVPVEAQTSAQTEGLNLANGLVTATLIKATSESTPGASQGDTVVADLMIAGIDVCDLLGLEETCQPEPNTVISTVPGLRIVLNEQLGGDGDQTVNAVHIFVLGAVPGSTLPVGAEIIISSAHSDAHSAPSTT